MTFLELQDLVVQRGQHLAAQHGHTLGMLQQDSDGLYRASCTRCGAALVVMVRSSAAGSWGAATRTICQTAERGNVRPL